MSKTIRCPKCKAMQPLQPICTGCGFDIRAHYIKQKKGASPAGAGAATVRAAGGPKPPGKKIKCPKCATVQQLNPICCKCNYDIKAHVLRSRKAAAAQAAPENATVRMDAPAQARPMAGAGTKLRPSMGAGKRVVAGTGAGGALISLGDLFSGSMEMYKARALPVLLVWLVSMVITVAVIALLSALGAGLSALMPDSGGIVLGITGVLGVIVGLLAYAFVLGALMYSVTDDRVGLKTALKNSWRKKWAFVWLVLFFGFLVTGGYMFFIIPGVIISFLFVFSFFILADEDIGGMNAMLKSREYIRGRGWAVFLRLFIIWMVSGMVGGIPFIGPLLTIAAMPFILFFALLLYRNLKETAPQLESVGATFKDKSVYVATALAGFIVTPAIILYAADTYMKAHYGAGVKDFMSMGIAGISSIAAMEPMMEPMMSAPSDMGSAMTSVLPESAPPSRSPKAIGSSASPYEYHRFRGVWKGGNPKSYSDFKFTFGDDYVIKIAAPDGEYTTGVGGLYMNIGANGSGSVKVPPGAGMLDIYVTDSTMGTPVGAVIAGVYKFEFDKLIYCLGDPASGNRPETFNDSSDSFCFKLEKISGSVPSEFQRAETATPAQSKTFKPPSQAENSPASGEADIVFNGKREKFVLNSKFGSDTNMSEPENAVIEFRLPGKNEWEHKGMLVLRLDSTLMGLHYADGAYSSDNWMGRTYTGIGAPTVQGHRAAMYYIAYGGQVFFPKVACAINVDSVYEGTGDSKFMGEIENCVLTSAGVEHTLQSSEFVIRGVVPR